MATYASIKYDMDLSSNATGAGGMTLLSTQTASSSANVTFDSGINSTYKSYVFKFLIFIQLLIMLVFKLILEMVELTMMLLKQQVIF